MEIYLLVDCDGEPICAFRDQDKAIDEAESSGCKWIRLELHD